MFPIFDWLNLGLVDFETSEAHAVQKWLKFLVYYSSSIIWSHVLVVFYRTQLAHENNPQVATRDVKVQKNSGVHFEWYHDTLEKVWNWTPCSLCYPNYLRWDLVYLFLIIFAWLLPNGPNHFEPCPNVAVSFCPPETFRFTRWEYPTIISTRKHIIETPSHCCMTFSSRELEMMFLSFCRFRLHPSIQTNL